MIENAPIDAARYALLALALVSPLVASTTQPPSIAELARTPAGREPVDYTGHIQPEKTRYDGRLPHAVGVHHYQAFRANRTQPAEGGITGWTYNHQPYLAYWNGAATRARVASKRKICQELINESPRRRFGSMI